MKLKVYNSLYDKRHLYFFDMPEFHTYEGTETRVKWAGPAELAITTNDEVGLRIIQRKHIREIDGKPYEYKEGLTDTVTRIVKGSKGNTYEVTKGPEGVHCTCPGFQFRGKCKHTEEVVA